MTPTHHLSEALLIQRSAGTLPEALDVLAACHLTLCPACRAVVRELDAVGGAVLGTAAPAPLAPGSFEATLARIASTENIAANAESPSSAPSAPGDPVIPRPLLRYTGPFARIPWRRRVLGFARYDLPIEVDGRAVRLIQLPAGLRVPRHDHEAMEYGMVLTGGYDDDGGAYLRGDVAVHEPGAGHELAVHPGEPCTLLLVHSGRLLAKGPVGRLMSWIVDD